MRYLLALLLLPIFGFSQEYQGIVLDSLSNDPVPFATVIYNDGSSSLITNEVGGFTVFPESEEIQISGMGFHSKNLRLDSKELNVIRLARKEVELAEIVVLKRKETAREVMFKVFENLKKNYSQNKTDYRAFYRHYCKEDTAYGRLIEAAITLYDPKGHKQMVSSPKAKVQVRIDQIRRSFDYTKNFNQHDPISIYNTLKYDVTSYPSIHLAVPEEHNYRFLDTTYYNGSWVYVIGYNYAFVKQHKRPIEFQNEGKIFVNTSDYAILKIEEKQSAEREDVFIKYTYNMTWEVNYTKIKDRYHLTYAKESGYNNDFYYDNTDSLLYTKDHLFNVEIMVNAINDVNPESFKGSEPDKKQLDRMNYHPEFWRTFPVLKDSPLNKEIIRDLEQRKSLEEQYLKEN